MPDRLALAEILVAAGLAVDADAAKAWEKDRERLKALTAQAPSKNTVRIFGPIMPQSEFVTRIDAEYGIQSASAASVQRVVDQADGGDITVEMNTIGGVYPEGVAIAAVLDGYRNRTGSQLHMRGLGQVQSAGAFIFLRGDTRLVDPLAMSMLHEVRAYSPAIESLAQIRARAEQLEKWISQSNADTAGRLGMKESEYAAKIADGKNWYLTAQEAVEVGFATGIIEATKADDADDDTEAAAPEYGAMAHLQFAMEQNAPIARAFRSVH